MRLIHHIQSIPATLQGSIVTIGNFDGVHSGHQALLEALVETKRRFQQPIVVVLFEPQPLEFFLGNQAPARLSRLRDKLLMLRRYPIDYVLCLRFGAGLSAMSAEDFVSTILVKRLQVAHLFVGPDFRFGRDRRGDIALLQAYAAQAKFAIHTIATQCFDGVRVSSTRIREVLAQGKLKEVRALLGRDYQITGRVMRGDQRGRQIGFPTANIGLHRRVSPLSGVYAVWVEDEQGQRYRAVANVGTRPTVCGLKRYLEVHLFDFSREIYGVYLTVSFMEKIREEKKFASLVALKEQIQQDCEEAKKYFN